MKLQNVVPPNLKRFPRFLETLSSGNQS